MSEPNARTATIHYTTPPQDITGGYLIPKTISVERKGIRAAMWRALGVTLLRLWDTLDGIRALGLKCLRRGREDRDTTGWVKLGEVSREE